MSRILTAAILVPVVVWIILYSPPWAFVAALAIVGGLALREFYEIGRAAQMSIVAAALAGIIYIYGAWTTAYFLRAINQHWLLFAFLLCWAGDTAAMYVGKAFGRHKLAPVISPAKTLEGAAASVAGGVLAGVLYMHFFLPAISIGALIAIGIAGNVAGQLGDLAESWFKRRAGVKDSGNSLPGHGGWLDRIDSSLFSVPVVYFLVQYTVR